MFYSAQKSFFFIITLFFFILTNKPIWSQENATTFFGPFYRTNQFLPILVHQPENFSATYIENKFSRDSLIFNQSNFAEALVKIAPNGTLFELVDKKNDRKILNLIFRILPEETPLFVIVGQSNATDEVPNERIKITETNCLPSFSSAYNMIEALYIKNSYKDTLTSQQTDAIREWVLSGGIIIFESLETIKKHSGLAVPLLKQTNPKKFKNINDQILRDELNNTVTNIIEQKTVTQSGYGYIGIKSIDPKLNSTELSKYCDGRMEWQIRNRNNFLSEKNSLKQEISASKIQITQKLVIIYFLLFMIFVFLKPTNYLTRIVCFISIVSIIPAILFAPSDLLDAHYYQILEKNESNEFGLIKEEVYLRQGNIPEVNIELKEASPYFVNNNSKIILSKNLRGQYIKQTIQSNEEYSILKNNFLTKNFSFEKIQKEKQTFFLHKLPITSIYEVSEPEVKKRNFNIQTSNKESIISKLDNTISSDSRDNYEKKVWYSLSNQLLYETNHPLNSFIVIESSAEYIPLDISPQLTTQKSYYSYLFIPEK
jgi:hypothetical protein